MKKNYASPRYFMYRRTLLYKSVKYIRTKTEAKQTKKQRPIYTYSLTESTSHGLKELRSDRLTETPSYRDLKAKTVNNYASRDIAR